MSGLALRRISRVSPAMMALVTRGRELLLARAHRFPAGRYSALAGSSSRRNDRGLHSARGEGGKSGIDVDGITYFASQSWAFPHSLMIASPPNMPAATFAPMAARSRRCTGSRRRVAGYAAIVVDRATADRRHRGAIA